MVPFSSFAFFIQSLLLLHGVMVYSILFACHFLVAQSLALQLCLVAYHDLASIFFRNYLSNCVVWKEKNGLDSSLHDPFDRVWVWRICLSGPLKPRFFLVNDSGYGGS